MRRLLGDEDCVDVEDDDGMCATTTTDANVAASPGPTGPTGAICFTGDSLLTLEDGSTKKFRDLQVRSCDK